MSHWYELADMTSPEFGEALSQIRLALQPIGATEQHGPNLAMGTDFRSAQAIARRLAEQVHPRALVLPPLPYGISHHHMDFPGSITLTAESLLALLFDVAKSVKHHGLTHLLFINGHGGNNAILEVAGNKIRYELGVRTATMFYFKQASDAVSERARTDLHGHACEIETSVMLYLVPELVRQDQLAEGDIIESDRRYADKRSPFSLQEARPFAVQTRNGVLGDARLASQEAGEAIVVTALARAKDFVDGFLAS